MLTSLLLLALCLPSPQAFTDTIVKPLVANQFPTAFDVEHVVIQKRLNEQRLIHEYIVHSHDDDPTGMEIAFISLMGDGKITETRCQLDGKDVKPCLIRFASEKKPVVLLIVLTRAVKEKKKWMFEKNPDWSQALKDGIKGLPNVVEEL